MNLRELTVSASSVNFSDIRERVGREECRVREAHFGNGWGGAKSTHKLQHEKQKRPAENKETRETT
jgi:hypothetical protein